METTFDTAAIRELLNDAFADEELRAFCYDHFRDAYDQLVPGMGKLVKVHYLIEHCERHGRLAELLQLVEQYNPYQYQRYEQRLTERAAGTADGDRRARRGLVTLLTAMSPPSTGWSDRQRAMVQLAFQVILAQILNVPLAQVEVAQLADGGAVLQALLPLEAIARLVILDSRYLAEEVGILEVQIATTLQQEHGVGAAESQMARADAGLSRALDLVRALMIGNGEQAGGEEEATWDRSWQLPRLNTKFGTLMEGYRRDRGLTQADLAHRLDGEWSASTIGRYERGQQTPPPRFVLQLVRQLALADEEEAALLNALQADVMLAYLAEYNAAKGQG